MNMFGGLTGRAQHIKELTDIYRTVFLCGPNRKCDHVMDRYEPIVDSDGRECGATLVCSRCGETAFNMSVWDGF